MVWVEGFLGRPRFLASLGATSVVTATALVSMPSSPRLSSTEWDEHAGLWTSVSVVASEGPLALVGDGFGIFVNLFVDGMPGRRRIAGDDSEVDAWSEEATLSSPTSMDIRAFSVDSVDVKEDDGPRRS